MFFDSGTGREPVNAWLRKLTKRERRTIAEDIRTVQMRWPLGMPKVRKLLPGLWEIRSNLHRKNARILFTTQENDLVLLHGFVKKSQKTPDKEIKVGRQRLTSVLSIKQRRQ